jgi:hypothetical protein
MATALVMKGTPMPSLDIVISVAIAAFGWIATIVAIRRSKLTERNQRMLMLPSWLPWIAFALGGPALTGALPSTDALSIGGAVTVGLMLPAFLSWISPNR